MKLLGSLERFAKSSARRAAEEARPRAARCELCAGPIGDPHRHVVELERRALLCACGACAVLFGDPASGGGRFRTVPDSVRVDPALVISDAEWAALGIPVRIAFVIPSSRRAAGTREWVAFYPSPGGSIEAEAPKAPWEELRARSPLVASVEEDVEALHVQRPRGGAVEALVAPVDACYELVALVRAHWRGFDGGDEAARVVEDFFARLRARSAPIARPVRRLVQPIRQGGGSR